MSELGSRPVLLSLVFGALLGLGCEEERRAWVSILPAREDEEETAPERVPDGPLGVSEDGRAVLLGEDTLFNVDRLPAWARGPAAGGPFRFERVVFSPDSSRVAFSTVDGLEAVGLWSRPAQTAVYLEGFAGGRVDSLAWAPEGRYLAWEGRSPEGVSRVSIADQAGRRLRHAIPEWLVLEGRSATFQRWIDPTRARVLVVPGPLAYVWDVLLNNFLLESHIEPLAGRAPPAPPARGGIFSLDLLGDQGPETVALYRSAGAAPAALLLESRAGEFRARRTDPLLEPADVGLERWEDGTPNLGLYAPLRMGGVPILLIELPSPDPGVVTVGAYRAASDATLETVRVVTSGGVMPAIFHDGRVGDENRELGVVDLDDDGSPELVVAKGSRVVVEGNPSVRWQATVLGWRGDGLAPRPELERAALARIARASGAPSDTIAAPDTTTADR